MKAGAREGVRVWDGNGGKYVIPMWTEVGSEWGGEEEGRRQALRGGA